MLVVDSSVREREHENRTGTGLDWNMGKRQTDGNFGILGGFQLLRLIPSGE